MTFVVLFILALVWAVYLVSWLRSRTVTSGRNSISSFSDHLSTLERTSPAAGSSIRTTYPRPRLSPQKKRRRDILLGLLVADAVTFLGLLAVGGLLTMLFVLSFLLTVGYVSLLVTIRRRALERSSKVRVLAPSSSPWRAAEQPVPSRSAMPSQVDLERAVLGGTSVSSGVDLESTPVRVIPQYSAVIGQ